MTGEALPETTYQWWALNGTELMAMLRRVAAGEDPDMVYMEAYANAEREDG